MINLMVKSIFENSTKIDNIVKHVNKANKKFFISSFMLSVTIWSIAKMVEKHETRLNNLEAELEEIKSKGE